jgi:hypothetical protein
VRGLPRYARKTPGVAKQSDLVSAGSQFPDVGTEPTEAQIFWIAKRGICPTGMFANGAWSPDQDLWMVCAYIKRIKSLPPAVEAAIAKLVEAQH